MKLVPNVLIEELWQENFEYMSHIVQHSSNHQKNCSSLIFLKVFDEIKTHIITVS